jgi:nucleoid-associated protein YgaU
MQSSHRAPMPTNVTAFALAQPRRAVPTAVAPAAATARLRRVTGTWSEPEPWTVAVLLVTGVVVIARHPLAQLIGTEPAPTPTVAPVVATAPATATLPVPEAAAGAAAVSVPTHEPRDPFRALVNASGRVLAPEAVTPARAATPAEAASAPAASAAATGACAGTPYTVRSGDTLWAIAAQSVASTNGKKVEVRWHRVYADNRSAIGADPSLLPVGVRLCLPR